MKTLNFLIEKASEGDFISDFKMGRRGRKGIKMTSFYMLTILSSSMRQVRATVISTLNSHAN